MTIFHSYVSLPEGNCKIINSLGDVLLGQVLGYPSSSLISRWACLKITPKSQGVMTMRIIFLMMMMMVMIPFSLVEGPWLRVFSFRSFCPSLRPMLNLQACAHRRSIRKGDHLTGQQVEAGLAAIGLDKIMDGFWEFFVGWCSWMFKVICWLFIHMCIHMMFLDLCLLFMIDCSCVLLICMNVQRFS